MFTTREALRLILLAAFVAGAPRPADAQTPLGTAFTFQGQLKDTGLPVDDTADFQFRLFDAASLGNLIAGPVSVSNVGVVDGLFTTSIDFGAPAFNGQSRWMEIAARSPAGSGTFTTLTTRQPLTAAPYARFSASAGAAPWTGLTGIPAGFADGIDNGSGDGHSLDAADGSPVNALFVDNAGSVGIGTTTPQAKLHLLTADEGVRIQGSSAGVANQAYLAFRNASGTPIGYVGDGSAIDNAVFLSADSGDVVLNTQAGRSLVVSPSGNVGIGTSGPGFRLDVHAAFEGDGVRVHSDGTNSPGIRLTGGGHGFFGLAEVFYAYSGDAAPGDVVLGGDQGKLLLQNRIGAAAIAINDNNVGIGTTAPASKLHVEGSAPTLQSIGYFANSAVNGVGLKAVSTWTGGGEAYGARFEAAGTFGRAVYGIATAQTGDTEAGHFYSSSEDGTGVFGGANSSGGATIGVAGSALAGGATNWGVYSYGRFGASGTKAFRIDHPKDPENKYLHHYCAEGPEPMNEYSGIASLDAQGEAWIELPEYFSDINRDPRILLSAIGAAMPNLHVAREIDDRRFMIAGGAAGARASWEVKAVRNDLWVQRYGAPLEIEKPTAERGKYQHPELYGRPVERGTTYHAGDSAALPD